MGTWNTALVRVTCSACTWAGWRDPATMGEKKCPKCNNEVKRKIKRQRRIDT